MNLAKQRYTKKQLLVASRYADKKDLLAALLHDNVLYTHKQVQSEINKYLKGVV